mgnify:CR=1 FL=1
MTNSNHAAQTKPRDETALNVILGALAFFFVWFIQRVLDNLILRALAQAGIASGSALATTYRTLIMAALWAVGAALVGALIQLPNIKGWPLWRFALAAAAMMILFLPMNLLWHVVRPTIAVNAVTTVSIIVWLAVRMLIALVGVLLLDWPRPQVARLVLFLTYALLAPNFLAVIPALQTDLARLGLFNTALSLVGLMVLGAGFGVALPRPRQEARRLIRERRQGKKARQSEHLQEASESQ